VTYYYHDHADQLAFASIIRSIVDSSILYSMKNKDMICREACFCWFVMATRDDRCCFQNTFTNLRGAQAAGLSSPA